MYNEDLTMKSNNIKGILYISLFILLLVGFNKDWNNNAIIWWGSVGFASIIMINIIFIKNIRINSLYTGWIFIFIFIALSSYFWAQNKGYVLETMKTLLVNSTVLFFLYCVIESEKDIITILKMTLFSIAINSIYLFSKVDLTLIGELQIGIDILGSRWNGNEIGNLMSIGVLISLLLTKFENRKLVKIIYIIIRFFLIFIALFTGSRKTLFFIIFSYSLYTLLTNENRKIITMLKIILILSITYVLIMNIPELYNVLGKRVEGLIAQLTGIGVVDGSTKLRMLYIEYGKEWLCDRPLLGYGLANYKELLGRNFGRITYSHNNYIEMLVNLGIIGTIVYYFGYIYILKNTVIKIYDKNLILFKFVFVLIITSLIGQYGSVVYNDFLTSLMLCISFSIIKIYTK